MEANAGMVAGSRNRNEFVMIRHESDSGVYSSLFFSLSGLLGFLSLNCSDRVVPAGSYSLEA